MKIEKEGLVVTPLTEQKTGLWDIAFIWFCANVAIPRLMIGGSLAELGFGKLILILLAGNILVFLPLLALGHLGYKVRIPTMAATRMTFGVKGSYVPSVANGIQLLGWGANVTVVCGSAINSVIKAMTGFDKLAAAHFRPPAGHSDCCHRNPGHQELRLVHHHRLYPRCCHRHHGRLGYRCG